MPAERNAVTDMISKHPAFVVCFARISDAREADLTPWEQSHVRENKAGCAHRERKAEMNENPVDTNGTVRYYLRYDYDENCEF
jgi:hypothetical protein